MESYNNENLINGWYYDLQLDNQLSSVTLHANTKKNGDSWGEWSGEKDSDGYGKDPICQAILNEDFSVTAANNWSEFGGDPLGALWSGIQPAAPYVKYIERTMGSLKDAQSKISRGDDNTWGGKLKNYIMDGVDKAAKWIDNKEAEGKSVSDYLRRALVVQGTRFTYYGGTGIAFSNLGMKFTVFPIWSSGSFKTVNDQLKELWPYFIGDFVKDDLLDIDFAKEFVYWQKPPGDFTPDVKDIDEILKGTLMLKFGPHYRIKNLLCGDVTLNFSKQMVKQPEGDNVKISPLYCDVSLTLKPATKFSNNALIEFVSGDNDDKKEVEQKINNNLKAIKGTLIDYNK